MSVQFGRWNIDGRPADYAFLAQAEQMLSPYGPDGGSAYIKDSVGILYRAFHTTKESRSEAQPHITPSGAVLTWDGRLDNRAEIIRQLRDGLTVSSTDVSIAAAAYEEWGTNCFAKLIGDWALSIWDTNTRSLVLAKDPIGTRPLYYSFNKDQVTWSTILDPLVLLAGKSFDLEEEYIAGLFSSFPAFDLTPYVGIHSVPPSSSVLIRAGRHTVSKYWDFDPNKKIRYKADREYEEHFRAVFTEAVRRRLRSDSPILAELSGGMDSSSIVCMADIILARGTAETPRLDTISYYDDSEPNWNERPYFTKVEKKRGRTGCHIDIGKQESFPSLLESERFRATPSSSGARSSESIFKFAACLTSQGNRVVLSGIGGDEVTGGVPTPTPELAYLLGRARFSELAHQLKMWALNKRRPWVHLLLEAGRVFAPSSLVGISQHKRPVPWLNPDFVRRNRRAFEGYESRVKLFGPLPSFQENVFTLKALQRQLACNVIPSEPTYEKQYPFLDRSFLEFVFAVPREQLIRPGQRRSLMRRALAGLVPDELLNRKRKAFLVRAPMAAIADDWTRLIKMNQQMVLSSMGIVTRHLFLEALEKARQGKETSIVPLMRSFSIEGWFRNLSRWKVLFNTSTGDQQKRTIGRIVSSCTEISFAKRNSTRAG